MCCLLWHIYEIHPVLSHKSGCDNVKPLINYAAQNLDYIYIILLSVSALGGAMAPAGSPLAQPLPT
jgi:hypothetical protein